MRDDNLRSDGTARYGRVPMKSTHGSLRVPDDVVAALGHGDPEMGIVVLYDLFASEPYLSNGTPRILTPEIVRDIGHGNPFTGRKVLQKFIANVRRRGGNEYHGAVKVTKAEAAYHDHGTMAQHCAACVMFEPSDNSCTLVKGEIEPKGWCRYFEPTQ